MQPIAVTAGEPAGIGPDLCLELVATPWSGRVVVVADPFMLSARADQLGMQVRLRDYEPGKSPEPGSLTVLAQSNPNRATCGKPDPVNAQSLLDGLRRAVDGCRTGEFSALVTAPVQKASIIEAGVFFTGHTEYLAELTETPVPVMLLAANGLRVALASTHLPLRDVADYLTTERLRAVIAVLHGDLRDRFAIADPRINVCGLNPHAGESGHLGTEDRDIIAPIIADYRSRGMDIHGPLPADTAFTPAAGSADAILAMYHDQGLPVVKHASFGSVVNVTLGLPIIRTSVDHGTALDLAGSGKADPGSLVAAIEMAAELAAG